MQYTVTAAFLLAVVAGGFAAVIASGFGIAQLIGAVFLTEGAVGAPFPEACARGGSGVHFPQATSTAPAAIRAMPAQFGTDGRSPRKVTANTATSTTLSLSIGATRAASPSLRARK
jgi:hypothetical protein